LLFASTSQIPKTVVTLVLIYSASQCSIKQVWR